MASLMFLGLDRATVIFVICILPPLQGTPCLNPSVYLFGLLHAFSYAIRTRRLGMPAGWYRRCTKIVSGDQLSLGLVLGW